MRNNQLGLTLIHYREDKDGEEGGIRAFSVYSDSNSLCYAVGNAFAAATLRVFGRYDTPDPMGCRCDVVTTDDDDLGDENKQRFIRAVVGLEEQRHPEIEGYRGSGTWYLHAHLQRFPRVVEDYPKEEQAIDVIATSEHWPTLLSAVYMALMERAGGHDARAEPFDMKVRTNIDADNPLVGDLERMQQHHEWRMERRREMEGKVED